MNIRFGDVVLVDLSKNVGYEIGKVRPATVIQNDIGNERSQTTVVIPFTKGCKRLDLPTHYVVDPTEENGLSYTSTILGEQARVVDKSLVRKKIGHLEDDDIIKVVDANLANIPLNTIDTSKLSLIQSRYRKDRNSRYYRNAAL